MITLCHAVYDAADADAAIRLLLIYAAFRQLLIILAAPLISALMLRIRAMPFTMATPVAAADTRC